MVGLGPRRVGFLVVWSVGWVTAFAWITGDLRGFLGTWQGAAFLGVALAQGVVEATGLEVGRDTFRRIDVGLVFIPVAVAGALFAPYDHLPLQLTPWGPPLAAAGVALSLGGLVLRSWAQRTLGARFTAHVDARGDLALVESGPYRHLRHPSYLGLALVLGGSPLILESVAGALLGLGGLLPFLVLRIRHEERALREAHGEAYEAYARRVPGMLPRPWR